MTFADVWTVGRPIFAHLEETRRFAHVNDSGTIDNWLAREAALRTALSTVGDIDAMAGITAGVDQWRGGINSVLANPRAALDPWLVLMGKTINAQSKDPETIIAYLYRYMIDNTERIPSRAFTRGSASAVGGNTGTGTINRLTVDENGLPMEASHVEVVTARCVTDQDTGAKKGQEMFEFTGLAPSTDRLDYDIATNGTGVPSFFAGKSADDSLLNNASLSLYSGTAALPTAITGWTSSVAVIGDGTDYVVDTTNYYRAAEIEGTTPASLRILLSRTLTQKLSVRGTRLDRTKPYYLQLVWSRAFGSGTGDLTLSFGAQSVTVTIAAQAGWNILRIPIGTANWPLNAYEADPDISIQWAKTSGAGTYINIDDVIFTPYDEYGGTFYAVVGGATAFQIDDQFTFTDTATDTAILQRWFWRAYGVFLPATTGSAVTIADVTM